LGVDRNGVLQVIFGTLAIAATGYYAGRLIATRKRSPDHTHRRGAVVGSSPATPGTQPADHPTPPITLAGSAVAVTDETKHFKLIGTTGSGKSTAIREVLRTALARGDRALIADPDGGYLRRFYQPDRGDLILNPFDARSARWDLFGELRDPYDADQLARALIPDTGDASGREWRAYARTFLSSLLRSAHARTAALPAAFPKSASSPASATRSLFPSQSRSTSSDLIELWRRIAIATTDELRPLVQNTPAQPFLEKDNARMFGSIRSVTTASLAGLEHVAHQHAAPLSIRNFISGGRAGHAQTSSYALGSVTHTNLSDSLELPAAGALFMPYQARQIATVRGLIATWLRLAIF
jgi:hypothetical protein